jgi:hypothetical protein
MFRDKFINILNISALDIAASDVISNFLNAYQ